MTDDVTTVPRLRKREHLSARWLSVLSGVRLEQVLR